LQSEEERAALSVFKCRGIVLKERESGESDKQLTLFLKERGKINVTARGARNPKSKYMAGAQLFTYSDFVLFEKGRVLSVTQADVIESFYELRLDYSRLCAAACMAELCDKAVLGDSPSDEVLRLLLLSLKRLSKGHDPLVAQRAFEFKFYQLSGMEPCARICSCCGGPLGEGLAFGPDGALCSSCSKKGTPLSQSALKAIQHILSQDLPKIFQFQLDPSSLDQLKNASVLFMRFNLDVSLKSLETPNW
jgi:DNA repair protein RecO (recombination protein O)